MSFKIRDLRPGDVFWCCASLKPHLTEAEAGEWDHWRVEETQALDDKGWEMRVKATSTTRPNETIDVVASPEATICEPRERVYDDDE